MSTVSDKIGSFILKLCQVVIKISSLLKNGLMKQILLVHNITLVAGSSPFENFVYPILESIVLFYHNNYDKRSEVISC